MSIRNVLRIEKKKRVSADTNITDAYKVPYGQSDVGSALDKAGKFTKLWENPSPTSEFASQTVILNSADWDFLLIVAGTASIILQKGVSTYCSLSCPQVYNSRMILDTRQLHLDSNNNVIFESAFRIQQTSAGSGVSTTQNDSLCVPLAIYGIKL